VSGHPGGMTFLQMPAKAPITLWLEGDGGLIMINYSVLLPEYFCVNSHLEHVSSISSKLAIQVKLIFFWW